MRVKRRFQKSRAVWLILMAGGIGLLALVVPPLLAARSSSDSVPAETASVSNYHAAYQLAASGTLSVTEDITASFPINKHGIFRFWDTANPNDASIRHQPRNIHITRDGNPEPFELTEGDRQRFTVAKIGSASTLLTPGQHQYRITYTVDNALSPATVADVAAFATEQGAASAHDQSALAWNLLPAGWGMPIQQFTATITTPDPVTRLRCTATSVGNQACTVTGLGTHQLTVSAANLPPRSPVTAVLTLPTTEPAQSHLPWSSTWDPVLGRNVASVWITLGLSVLVGLAAFVWLRRTYETPPGAPLTYEPPPGIGPVQAYYLAYERIPQQALSATLMHQAASGLVQIERHDKGQWTLTPTAHAAWGNVDATSQAIARSLGTIDGQPFTTAPSADSGQRLSTASSMIDASTKGWATAKGYVRSVASEYFAKAVCVVTLVAVLVWVVWGHGATIFALPFLVVGSILTPTLLPQVGMRRTSAAHQLWAHTLGFERVLSTPSSISRFDFSGRQDLYTAYIPWAVAFGCADVWAQKYVAEVGTEPPMPLGFIGFPYIGPFTGADIATSFDSAIDSSVSAYAAEQAARATENSGRGDTGGGWGSIGGFDGGGGGGGGSW